MLDAVTRFCPDCMLMTLFQGGIWAFVVGILSMAGLSGQPGAPPLQKTLAVNPEGRVLVQCAFVPYDGNRRLYACLVGTPSGVHYAYDFDLGAPFLIWRGRFADMSGMWVGAAHDQIARPAENAIQLPLSPAFAMFPARLFTLPESWPGQPEPLYRSHGYELERDGQPVFLASLEALVIRDRIAPAAVGRGLERTIAFSGRLSPWETWLLVGEASVFTTADNGWIAEGDGWWIEWPAGTDIRPVIRNETGRQLLALKLETRHLSEPVRYTLCWK